jgi:hypothetical protein
MLSSSWSYAVRLRVSITSGRIGGRLASGRQSSARSVAGVADGPRGASSAQAARTDRPRARSSAPAVRRLCDAFHRARSHASVRCVEKGRHSFAAPSDAGVVLWSSSWRRVSRSAGRVSGIAKSYSSKSTIPNPRHETIIRFAHEGRASFAGCSNTMHRRHGMFETIDRHNKHAPPKRPPECSLHRRGNAPKQMPLGDRGRELAQSRTDPQWKVIPLNEAVDLDNT